MKDERLKKLVEQARQHDETALYDLYQETFPGVYYLALRMLKNTQDAEDITQETFIAVWKNIGTLLEPTSFVSWVNLIAANKCRDVLRKKGVPLAEVEGEAVEDLQIAELDDALLPDSALDNEETRRLVLKVVDSLPEAQRMCILLYYYHGLSVEQIAGVMECSSGTVKSRLSAARAKIKIGIETIEDSEGIRLHGAAIGLLPFLQADAVTVSTATVAKGLFDASIGTAAVADTVGKAGLFAKIQAGLAKLTAGAKVAVIGGGTVVVGGAVTVAVMASAYQAPTVEEIPEPESIVELAVVEEEPIIEEMEPEPEEPEVEEEPEIEELPQGYINEDGNYIMPTGEFDPAYTASPYQYDEDGNMLLPPGYNEFGDWYHDWVEQNTDRELNGEGDRYVDQYDEDKAGHPITEEEKERMKELWEEFQEEYGVTGNLK